MIVTALLWMLVDLPGSDAAYLGALFKARYAMARGDLSRALTYCDEAEALKPGDADAAYLHIELLTDLGDADPVVAERRREDLRGALQGYIRRFPEDPRFVTALGILLVKSQNAAESGDLAPAEVYLEKALTLMGEDPAYKPERSDVWYYLGLLHYRNGDMYDASRAFCKVVTLEPDAGWAWYYAARSLEGSHQLRKALRYYEKYQEMASYDPIEYDTPVPYTVLLLRVMTTSGAGSLQALIDWLAQQDNVRELHYAAVERLTAVGRYSDALALARAVKHRDRELNHMRVVSLIRMRLHDYDALYREVMQGMSVLPVGLRKYVVDYAAEAALCAGRYADVVALRHAYPATPGVDLKLDLYAAFAEVLGTGAATHWQSLAGKYSEDELMSALRDQVAALGLRPVALRNVAQVAMEWEDWSLARRDLETLAQILPPEQRNTDDLAVALYLSNEPARAFAVYEDLLARFPDRDDLRNNYAYFLAESGRDPERARQLAAEAVARRPDDPAFMDSLGWACFKAGRHAEAKSWLQQALAAEPDDPEKLEHLGDVLWAMGEADAARDAWVRAMEGAEDRYLLLLDKLDPAL